jgi:hypothetical protein
MFALNFHLMTMLSSSCINGSLGSDTPDAMGHMNMTHRSSLLGNLVVLAWWLNLPTARHNRGSPVQHTRAPSHVREAWKINWHHPITMCPDNFVPA